MGFFSQIILVLFITLLLYSLISIILTIILARGPNRPVGDIPDWGMITDHRIRTRNGKEVEVWVVYPEGIDVPDEKSKVKPAVIMTHGWSRNRGRMVNRARQWKELGFTTILFSTRNHGNSDRERIGASIIRFSHDIEDVISWWGHPLIVQGHSIGAGASILAAGRNNGLIKALVAESPLRSIPEDLYYIYKPVFKRFTRFIIPGLKIALFFFFFPYRKEGYSPIKLVKEIKMPALFVHGKKDILLPYEHSEELHAAMKGSTLCLLENADHSSIADQPEYINCVEKFVKKYDLI